MVIIIRVEARHKHHPNTNPFRRCFCIYRIFFFVNTEKTRNCLKSHEYNDWALRAQCKGKRKSVFGRMMECLMASIGSCFHIIIIPYHGHWKCSVHIATRKRKFSIVKYLLLFISSFVGKLSTRLAAKCWYYYFRKTESKWELK